ncbi:MAG TPA: hypothetical protein VEH27_19040 [Methylomirabilota bacterium]|nr:hypothetical protein [Methylomirabilota bacterium]
MAKPLEHIIHFVVDRAQNEPVSKRVELYRALADVCGDEKESLKFSDLAEQLEATAAQERQIAFDFRNRFGQQ